MKPKKAPGLDIVTAGILRQAWPELAHQITHAFNVCQRTSKFPNCWKNTALVVIRKSPDEDSSEVKSYRPISLLPVLSKALEHLIVARIRGDTAPHMSGFTKNLSTVDAMHCALQWTDSRQEKYVTAVFLDISGAFDCLWWAQLVKDLEAVNCRGSLIELTKSYLDDRQAIMAIGNRTVTRSLTKGCPQGSEYGHDLWKYAVNPLLCETLPEGTELIAYADDLALLIAGKRRPELTSRANALLERALIWANQRKLIFSAAKSQTLWLKGKLSTAKK